MLCCDTNKEESGDVYRNVKKEACIFHVRKMSPEICLECIQQNLECSSFAPLEDGRKYHQSGKPAGRIAPNKSFMHIEKSLGLLTLAKHLPYMSPNEMTVQVGKKLRIE